MRLMRRVALDWAELDEIDPRILIQGVEPAAGKETANTVSLWGGVGSRMSRDHRDSLDIKVQFSLDIKRDRMQDRSAVFERVMAWAAKGGWLTLSQKPGRRVRVYAAQLPDEGDPLAWTQRYTITFRALGVPYWQRIQPNTLALSLSGASASGQISVLGSADTVLDLEYTNGGSGTVNSLDVTAGSSEMHLRSLGLAAGETLVADHVDNGRWCVRRIRIRNTQGVYRSAYGKLTPASSDDLTVSPGLQAVTLTGAAGGELRAECFARFV